MTWKVRLTAKVRKRLKKLPTNIDEIFQLLLAEIKLSDPVQCDWPNYSKLKGKPDCHNCHLQRSRPTYGAGWRVLSQEDQLMEVTQVGTHEQPTHLSYSFFLAT
jgi:mRNA-degrading endonuclease RelE of RelBE toxin-antitoxin system